MSRRFSDRVRLGHLAILAEDPNVTADQHRRRRDAFPPWFNPSLLCQRSSPNSADLRRVTLLSRAAHGRRFAPQHERCDFFYPLFTVGFFKHKYSREQRRLKMSNSSPDGNNATRQA